MKTYELYLLDMDGTLYLGEKLFPCTPPFLRFIREAGARAVYLTNNSSRSVTDYVAKLARLGISATPEDFYTSADAAVSYLRAHYPGRTVYAFGTRSFCRGLADAGIRVTDKTAEADLLLMGYDTELTYRKLEDACELLRRGVPYLATNPDLVCPTETGYLPDCGSVSIMLKNATGREPLFLGKPRPAMVELCLEKFGVKKENALLVGDRLYTDIKAGVAAGIDTALVLSGETTAEMAAASDTRPTYCLPDVSHLIVRP